MQIRPVPPGGVKETGDRAGSGPGADWRQVLRRHADSIWRGEPRVEPGLDALLVADLGPLAGDVLRIVEAYARGSQSVNGAAADPPGAFEARLDLILNGIAASLGEAATDDRPGPSSQPNMIQSELWQLLRKVRESAELAYAREQYLIELDRRILFLLQDRGPMVPAELSEFYDVIEILLDRAVVLYEQERRLAQGTLPCRPAECGAVPRGGEPAPGEKVAIDRSRVIAPLMTLSSYFSRSGSLAFKRLTGLSSFEAFVLSEIGMDPPIDWSMLVSVLARDHSQAGRTVNSLMKRGLIIREGKPGRRHGRFLPSREGARLHAVIHEAGRQRSAFLLTPLKAEQRARFLATFDKLRRNATAQLERERAFAEIDRP